MPHAETPPPVLDPEVEALTQALAAPFERKFVKFRPGATSGSRALAIPYVDARVIQDRLDDVLGSVNWQDEYEFLPDGSVMCRLRLRLGGEWITKMDVGGPSEQPDEGDRRKAAVSDALKRAAVKFGVGRYLYRLPQQWVDYDPQKKQLKNLPPLPEPAGKQEVRGQRSEVRKQAAREAMHDTVLEDAPAPTVVKPARAAAKETAAKGGLPASGAELKERLTAYDAQLARKGRCRPGELLEHVAQAGVKAGFEPDLTTWGGPAILLAVEETKAFEARLKKGAEKVVA
jgi:hypothetical protein